MANKVELTFNDKINIFWIKNIYDSKIISENWTIAVFEYFSLFKKHILFDIIKEKKLDFQVKIKKERFNDVKNIILWNKYLDLSKLKQKVENEFSIIINDDYRENIDEININPDDIIEYLTEEKWELYIYRHYLAINISNIEKEIDSIIYELFLDISNNKDVIIRRLNNDDLEDYLFKEINYPYNKNDVIQTYTEDYNNTKEDKKQNLLLNILDPVNYATLINNGLKKVIWIIDNAYFQWKVNWIWWFILDLYEQKMFKWDNFIQIWNNYKGGLLISKWFPTDNFNILNNIFFYLEKWDSVTINIYWENKHKIEENREVKWIEKILLKNTNTNEINNIDYLQILINFNDINPDILNERIQKFQLKIWTDFYCQRIVNAMSRYISTAIWIWINKLNTERWYDSERLRNNLIF